MLFEKNDLENSRDWLKKWQQAAFEDFANMMTSTKTPYPCVPGVYGFKKNMLRYGFLETPTKETASKQLAQILTEYGDISRQTGPFASLVVFINTEEERSVEAFETMFWTLLQKVHQLDEKSWPEHIPTEPHDNEWEFCFQGEAYFVFCATPAHTVRKSRHFPYMLLAFQPRWVFDQLNGETSFGRKMKNIIRKRLIDYDYIPPHAALKWYGEADNYEWKQYFLRDDNSAPTTCPFHTGTKTNHFSITN
ncbi:MULTISPECIES: YqcI/YcgG family protein [unclassified Virgibacillus]|uniref:YqcI/YcgG family protein n=1 Tax=unclassified Virgibacillus TaxID=2620237 RepID=UPI0024DEE44C|nr:YqcI/YcgG family protein [Virgibacillus sp. LDC-1]